VTGITRTHAPAIERQYGVGMSRFPSWVYAAGAEPDARFSLANERTFLSWIRTGLALSAAGVALEALELPIAAGLRLASAVILVGLGVVTPVLAWLRWAALERGMRLERPLPSPLLGPVLTVGTAVASALVLIGLVIG
jgi:putative membrane protein